MSNKSKTKRRVRDRESQADSGTCARVARMGILHTLDRPVCAEPSPARMHVARALGSDRSIDRSIASIATLRAELSNLASGTWSVSDVYGEQIKLF